MRSSTGAPFGASIAAACAALLLHGGLAAAQTPTAPAMAIKLEAQALEAALTEFARAADVQVLFAPELVAGQTAPAIEARLTPAEALERLLAGSDLVARQTGARTFTITRRQRVDLGPIGGAEEIFSEEIVVTAQRRPEQGQDVPVAVTGFGADAIDRLRLDTLRDVSRVTPGLLVSNFSYASPNIAIRGANNTFNQIGANRPVVVVLDDVAISRNSAANFELFGLNSIQVLKGPQGTLFGRNVTGGAVLIDTGRPEFGERQTRLRGTVGDYSARAVEALSDQPIGDQIAVRLAGSLRQRDGFGRDRLINRELDDQDSGAVRGQVRAQLTPGVEALFGADYADDRNNGRTLSITDGRTGDDGDPRTAEIGLPQAFARTQWGASARVFADLFGGELTSITAYRESQTGERFAFVGANFQFLPGGTTQQLQTFNEDRDEIATFSQEVRWASPVWDRGSFIVGLYYLNEDASRVLRQTGLRATTGVLGSDTTNLQTNESESFGVFADGTYNLTRTLSVTLGARYTADTKSASQTRIDAFTPANGFAGRVERDWSEVTPRAVLTWRPTEDLMTYVSYTRGYTAGGFNTDAQTLAFFLGGFAPETLASTEFGVKSDWLDGRLRANLTVFEQRYEDKQEFSRNAVTGAQTILNAAEATMAGGELEVRVIPTSWLALDATYGRLDTWYDRFVVPGTPRPIVNTGNALGSAPREKISFAADLRFPLAFGEALGSAVYSRTSDYNTGGNAAANLQIAAYDLVNLSAGVRALDDRWRFTAFVRNAEDTDYVLTYATLGPRTVYLGEPRTVGASLEVRF